MDFYPICSLFSWWLSFIPNYKVKLINKDFKWKIEILTVWLSWSLNSFFPFFETAEIKIQETNCKQEDEEFYD